MSSYNKGRSWHQDRRQKNRSESWENIPVKGYRRSDGTYVKPYKRRPPVKQR